MFEITFLLLSSYFSISSPQLRVHDSKFTFNQREREEEEERERERKKERERGEKVIDISFHMSERGWKKCERVNG